MSIQEPPSICNMYKDSISKIVNRMEKHLPVHLQMYSDMYKEYLHTLDDVFGTCMAAENAFEKMLPRQDFLKYVEPYADSMTNMWIKHVDNFDIYLKWYTQMRISYMKSYDESVHALINPSTEMLEWMSKSHERFGKDVR